METFLPRVPGWSKILTDKERLTEDKPAHLFKFLHVCGSLPKKLK